MAIRRVEEVSWGEWQSKVEVNLWDFSGANLDSSTRHYALTKMLGEKDEASLLLNNPSLAEKSGLPLEVLEFIRFGGKLSVRDSLRQQPALPFLSSLSNQEKQVAIRKHKELVATFQIKIPDFVYRELKLTNSGVSFYAPLDLEKKPLFWDPGVSLDVHFIFQNQGGHAWRIFQKLQELKIPQEEAKVILGANILRNVWLQGDYDDVSCLLGATGFEYSLTSDLVAQMYELVKAHQPSFERVGDPALAL